MRNQHAQRRCDHHGAGEGRHSHCPNNFSSADCQNGQRQSRRARKRNCTSGGRCECLAGRREETTAAVGGKGPRNPIEGQRVMRLIPHRLLRYGRKKDGCPRLSDSFRAICPQFRCGGASFSSRGEGFDFFSNFWHNSGRYRCRSRRIAGRQISVKTHC